jgi:cytochrome c oxidase assembly protein subunit 11
MSPFTAWRRLKNTTRTLVLCLGVLVFMVGFTAAAVPLYYLLCQALGIANPGQISANPVNVDKDTGEVSNRTVTVRFIANTAKGVPVQFAPLTTSMRVRLGEYALTAYAAHNTRPAAMDGIAVHMVYGMGGNAGSDLLEYIDLQQCFCFESQHYAGNTSVRLPLSFRILSTLPEGVHTLTFAYTLFEALPNDPRAKKHAEIEL